MSTLGVTRRRVLGTGASALGLAGLSGLAGLGLGGQATAQTPASPPLTDRALPYGVAVHHESFWADPALRTAIASHCDQITIENAMKMEYVLADPERYDFAIADTLAGWAIQNGLGVHGHTLIWYGALPAWVAALDTHARVETLFARHIATMVDQYRHVVRTWDVVNEAVPDYPDSPDTMRDCVWLDHLGRDYVAQAFVRARDADPDALLVLNEYDIEFAVENGPAKREAFRRVVLRLLDAGAPIDAIGFQAHLRGNWAIATEEVAALVAEMAGYGLQTLVTELDVIDTDLPADVATRDRLVAEQVESFLSAVGREAPLRSISTWGLTDQHSWIRWVLPREDGRPNRPLPLDWDYAPKTLHVRAGPPPRSARVSKPKPPTKPNLSVRTDLALQITLHPHDVAVASEILPRQLAAWAPLVDRLVLTIDSRARLDCRGTALRDARKALFVLFESLRRHHPDLGIDAVVYADHYRDKIARAYFGGRRDWPDYAVDGSPFYALFFGLMRTNAHRVLHLAPDALHTGPHSDWLAGAQARLDADSHLLALAPHQSDLPTTTGPEASLLIDMERLCDIVVPLSVVPPSVGERVKAVVMARENRSRPAMAAIAQGAALSGMAIAVASEEGMRLAGAPPCHQPETGLMQRLATRTMGRADRVLGAQLKRLGRI